MRIFVASYVCFSAACAIAVIAGLVTASAALIAWAVGIYGIGAIVFLFTVLIANSYPSKGRNR